jgi:hypothetical protein
MRDTSAGMFAEAIGTGLCSVEAAKLLTRARQLSESGVADSAGRLS